MGLSARAHRPLWSVWLKAHQKNLHSVSQSSELLQVTRFFDDIFMQHMYDKNADSVTATTAAPSICWIARFIFCGGLKLPRLKYRTLTSDHFSFTRLIRLVFNCCSLLLLLFFFLFSELYSSRINDTFTELARNLFLSGAAFNTCWQKSFATLRMSSFDHVHPLWASWYILLLLQFV